MQHSGSTLSATSSNRSQLHTPPASPHSSISVSLTSSSSFTQCPPPALYFKALHAYTAQATAETRIDDAACLNLQPNAVLYIHSVHPSGWADGSMLDGARGWFPSNFCEPYTLSILAPLSDAVQLLTHLVRTSKTIEYIGAVSAIIAAVREMLVEANCLTRESALIQQLDVAKRERKCLLAELSTVVSITKRSSLNLKEIGQELVQRGDRIMSRASRLIHAIGAESGIYALEQSRLYATLIAITPPVSHDFSTPSTLDQLEDGDVSTIELPTPNLDLSGFAHPVSLVLDKTHEALINVMTAFIARLQVQVQTQSAAPILQATRQCVNAARALLATLESIAARYPDSSIIAHKDSLYRNITRLVTTARQAVEKSNGVIFSTQILIDAATGVVRGAGQCANRAKYILELKGDFVLDEASEPHNKASPTLPRDDTYASLVSITDTKQSEDIQTQVESLSIPYKQLTEDRNDEQSDIVPQLSPRRPPISHVGSFGVSLSPTESVASEIPAVYQESDIEVNLNHESQIIGASMTALVQCITPADQTPDAQFSNALFLTFRLFCSPNRFAELLISRYLFTHTADFSHALPVRLRVYNVLKQWLELHWRSDQDSSALVTLRDFAVEKLSSDLPQAGARLLALCEKVQEEKPLNDAAQIHSIDAPSPPSIFTRQQATLLAEKDTTPCTISDFDELELARQFTIIESRIFCDIRPVELIGQEFSKKGPLSRAINIKAMSAASTDLAGWVADTILSETEQKKRTNVLRHWIKIAERCAQLHNYNTLMAIMCALNSSTIARLRRTWDGLARAQKSAIDNLRSITDHQRNYAVYRAKVKETVAPCLPFLGLYLTDLTFIDEGNPNHRPSKSSDRQLINFDKHMKTARVVNELQRLQVPYKLQPVPELIEWIATSCSRMRSSSSDLSTALWRQSLVIEPKLPTTMKRESSYASSADSEAKSESKFSKINFLANWSIGS